MFSQYRRDSNFAWATLGCEYDGPQPMAEASASVNVQCVPGRGGYQTWAQSKKTHGRESTKTKTTQILDYDCPKPSVSCTFCEGPIDDLIQRFLQSRSASSGDPIDDTVADTESSANDTGNQVTRLVGHELVDITD
jgi:hypothetical protein